jgi:hypothetical protein
MSRTLLLGTIGDKAASTFGKVVTKDNFTEWVDHWLATGDAWAVELEAKGLTVTAQAVRDHVKWQREHPFSKR